ncbi:MAG: ABC transporter substrate-binding protein, partial [Planctomycetota bacterium]|nr:ABC transporter substrate-binding protein [Planctomycetota bacterium]
MRSLAVFALATILTLLPVSADPETQERPTEPGDATLVLRFATEPPTLNPITYRDVYGGIILEYTNAYLYVEDKQYLRDVAAGKIEPRPEGPLKPELAASYPDISEDKLTWTIKLREGCKWHDGEEVTAHDIKASFEIMMNDKVDATRMRSYYEKIDEVIVEDDYTIKFKFKDKYYFAKYSLPGIPIAPLHIIEELDEPQDWNGIDQVVGCGPFKLENWDKGNEIVLVRNDDFWGDMPNIKRIRIKIIKDETAAIASLRRGEIDLMGIRADKWERDVK